MQNKFILPGLASLTILALSCRIQPGSNRNNDGENKIYRLRLNPPAGSKYHLQISNSSKLHLEVSEKEIDKAKKMDVGIDYDISKDSAGNFLFAMTYNKIHLYTKNGEIVSDLDAENAATSLDPVEEMLGALKTARLVATVSPAGSVRSVSGYREVADRVLTGINAAAGDKAKAQMQWKDVVEQGIIKKNMDQMFSIFPDSAVHVGDKWQLSSTEKTDLNFTVKSSYILKSISDGVANITCEGEIVTDSSSTTMMGYDVLPDLKGTQDGEYAMDIKTGMLLSCRVTAKITGTVQVMGREAKIKMDTEIKIDGQKL